MTSADEAPGPDQAPEALDALAAELRRVVGIADPVPERWRSVATAAYAWAAIDAAAAALVYDSHAVRGGRVGTSHVAGATVREMRFAAGPLTVELDVDAGADKVRVVGRVTPARAVEIAALWPEGRAVTTSDDGGSFRFDELPRRPLCLHVTGAPAVKTGWVVP